MTVMNPTMEYAIALEEEEIRVIKHCETILDRICNTMNQHKCDVLWDTDLRIIELGEIEKISEMLDDLLYVGVMY